MRWKQLVGVCLVLGLLSVLFFRFGGYLWQLPADLEASRKEEQARATLAFESLEHRMPRGKPISLPVPLTKEAEDRWARVDSNVEYQQARRAGLLKALHERTRRFFVNSSGFGSLRQLSDEDLLAEAWAEQAVAAHPSLPAAFPLSAGDDVPVIQPDPLLHEYHVGRITEFVHPSGFGYVKDRGHVAGFRSHGFRYLGHPTHPGRPWRVHHVLLVSILMNDRPLVYLSDKLPRMDLLNTGRSRPLDRFEEAGLKALADGEDLHAIRKDDTVRMLGALRATKQCLKCHDVKAGDLLGAFSYTLRLATADPRQHTANSGD